MHGSSYGVYRYFLSGYKSTSQNEHCAQTDRSVINTIERKMALFIMVCDNYSTIGS